MRVLAIFIVTIIVSALFSVPSCASSKRCPRHQIQTSIKGKLVKTRTFKGTSDSFSDYVLGHHRGNSQILGFVDQSEIYTKLNYKFSVQKIDENHYCVNLERVNGYFYAAPKLYLPTNYKKGSCEYNEIHRHEKRHLKVVYDFHKRNVGKYASYLGKIARTVPIFSPVNTQEEVRKVKQSIINYFENEFRIFENQSMIQLNAAQAKIDSPQEYRGVQKRCNNW
ncbi:MAG: hypothetical protein KAJ40_03260 [Alphaproteobacteria bacterium]|nr:hypothetical protein [Alphaproteobacteria bacterium]